MISKLVSNPKFSDLIRNKIKETEQKKEEVKEIKDETLKEVEQLNSQITDYQGQITSLDAQISDANAKIKEQETKLAQAENDYQEQQDTLEKRIVAVYESGETSYLDVLLSSEGLTDFISNYYLVSEVTQYDTEMLQEIQKQKEEIENGGYKWIMLRRSCTSPTTGIMMV